MQTLLIGALMAVAILTNTFLHSKAGLKTFLNPEGLIVVIGGTVAILFITSKKDELMTMVRMFKRLVLTKSRRRRTKDLLLEISTQVEKGRYPENTGHRFLDKSLGWLSAGLRGAELEKLLVEGAKLEIERIHQGSNVLANLSKYPPALGMVGTVFGIIAIFNSLNSTEGQKNIGVNLAFAMTATLYGLVLANFVVSPLAELLEQAAQEEEIEYSMIVETVRLWSERQSTFFVKEHIELYDAA